MRCSILALPKAPAAYAAYDTYDTLPQSLGAPVVGHRTPLPCVDRHTAPTAMGGRGQGPATAWRQRAFNLLSSGLSSVLGCPYMAVTSCFAFGWTSSNNGEQG